MNRRALLVALGGATASAAGCLGTQDTDDTKTEDKWRYEDSGRSLTISHGSVLATDVQQSDKDANRKDGIVALDAETGDRQWRYGKSSEYSGFSEPSVADAVYITKETVQSGTEDADSELSYRTTAIEFDGTVRWSTAKGRLERIDGGVAYVTTNPRISGATDTFRAIDTADGHERWSNEYGAISSVAFDALTETPGTAYIAGEDVVAVATDDGSEQWRYELGETHGTVQAVANGVAYVTDSRESITAVSDGQALWSVGSLTQPRPRILAATADSLFAETRNGLYVFDTTTGDERWMQSKVTSRHRGASSESKQVHQFPGTLRVQDDKVYVGGDRLYAVELADGTELWSEDFGEEPVQSLEIGNREAAGTDYSLFAQSGETNLHKVAPDGDVQWTWTDDGTIYDFAVNESIIVVSTESGTVALNYQ